MCRFSLQILFLPTSRYVLSSPSIEADTGMYSRDKSQRSRGTQRSMCPQCACSNEARTRRAKAHFRKKRVLVRCPGRAITPRTDTVDKFHGDEAHATGGSVNEAFTVRRISYGEGVERVFPLHSPNIDKIEVNRESVPMRARLYYLRGRKGKAAMAIKAKRNETAKA